MNACLYVLDGKLKKYKAAQKQIAHILLLCIMINIILQQLTIYFTVWLDLGCSLFRHSIVEAYIFLHDAYSSVHLLLPFLRLSTSKGQA